MAKDKIAQTHPTAAKPFRAKATAPIKLAPAKSQAWIEAKSTIAAPARKQRMFLPKVEEEMSSILPRALMTLRRVTRPMSISEHITGRPIKKTQRR